MMKRETDQEKQRKNDQQKRRKLLLDAIKTVLGDRITDEQIERVCEIYYDALKRTPKLNVLQSQR
jgi:hypothetical protein